MATVADQRALLRAIKGLEASVQNAFRQFLSDTTSTAAIRHITGLLEHGRLNVALDFVESHIVRLGDVIPEVFQAAGIAESRALSALTPARVAAGFNVTDVAAAALMRVNRLNFIREFSRQQRNATRVALTNADLAGQGPRAAARVFRDSMGLTLHQQNAVNSYRALLEAGSRQALNRALRDRRYDRAVQNQNDKPLTPTQIERMVEAYRRKLLNLRAETIARTETLRVGNMARREALLQTLATAEIAPERVQRQWVAIQDDRTRDTHSALHGQLRGLNEPFESPSGALLMQPGDPTAPAAETINCRCTVIVRIKNP